MEREAPFYDKIFAAGYRWQPYTPIYKWIARRVEEPVLDMGCGMGALAGFIHRRGVKQYTGIDFSQAAIQMAEKKKPDPGYRFLLADLREIPESVLDGVRTVTLCEVLEHLEADLELCRKIPVGVKVVGSLPTRRSKSHVRFFPEASGIEERYRGVIRLDEMERIQQWWCFAGIRSDWRCRRCGACAGLLTRYR